MTQKEELQLHGDTKEKKKNEKIYTHHTFKTVQMKCINIDNRRKKMSLDFL